MGSAVCLIFIKNFPRKGCGVPLWFIQVLLLVLSMSLLPLPRLSKRWRISLKITGRMVFACALWSDVCSCHLFPDGLSRWIAVKNAVCPLCALSVSRVSSSGMCDIYTLKIYVYICIFHIHLGLCVDGNTVLIVVVVRCGVSSVVVCDTGTSVWLMFLGVTVPPVVMM